jgi:hypothetical protein
MRQAVLERLTRNPAKKKAAGSAAASGITDDDARDSEETTRREDGPCAEWNSTGLTVTGIDHVVAVLEDLENGLLSDMAVVEPYACEGGCFGSPFFYEDFHVANRRWVDTCVETEPDDAPAVPRRLAYTARTGIRLDADMALAIEKLGRLQSILQELPGKDCGACGAPSCTALAEDVVLERAAIDDCPYLSKSKGRSL